MAIINEYKSNNYYYQEFKTEINQNKFSKKEKSILVTLNQNETNIFLCARSIMRTSITETIKRRKQIEFLCKAPLHHYTFNNF